MYGWINTRLFALVTLGQKKKFCLEKSQVKAKKNSCILYVYLKSIEILYACKYIHI